MSESDQDEVFYNWKGTVLQVVKKDPNLGPYAWYPLPPSSSSSLGKSSCDSIYKLPSGRSRTDTLDNNGNFYTSLQHTRRHCPRHPHAPPPPLTILHTPRHSIVHSRNGCNFDPGLTSPHLTSSCQLVLFSSRNAKQLINFNTKEVRTRPRPPRRKPSPAPPIILPLVHAPRSADTHCTRWCGTV
jgi:hypothetical protein